MKIIDLVKRRADWNVETSRPSLWNRDERERWAREQLEKLTAPPPMPLAFSVVIEALIWVFGAVLVLSIWGRPLLNILWSLIP